MNRLTYLLSLLVALALAACNPQPAEQTLPGSEGTLFGGTVSSHATLSAEGELQAITVTLPLTTVTGAGSEPAALSLALPQEVREKTFFDHLVLFWAPDGLGPDPTPLFDIHYFGLDEAGVSAIDCSDLSQPAPDHVPDGWLPPVPPGAPAEQFCVPQMGFHAVPEGTAQALDQIMVTGFYGGKMNFVEPIFSQALLASMTDFDLPVPQPKDLARSVLHPQRFEAHYDAYTNSYELVLRDFVTVQAHQPHAH